MIYKRLLIHDMLKKGNAHPTVKLQTLKPPKNPKAP